MFFLHLLLNFCNSGKLIHKKMWKTLVSDYVEENKKLPAYVFEGAKALVQHLRNWTQRKDVSICVVWSEIAGESLWGINQHYNSTAQTLLHTYKLWFRAEKCWCLLWVNGASNTLCTCLTAWSSGLSGHLVVRLPMNRRGYNYGSAHTVGLCQRCVEQSLIGLSANGSGCLRVTVQLVGVKCLWSGTSLAGFDRSQWNLFLTFC